MHTYVIILHFTVFIVNVLPRHYILQIINFLFLSRVLNVYFLMTFSVSRDRIEIAITVTTPQSVGAVGD